MRGIESPPTPGEGIDVERARLRAADGARLASEGAVFAVVALEHRDGGFVRRALGGLARATYAKIGKVVRILHAAGFATGLALLGGAADGRVGVHRYARFFGASRSGPASTMGCGDASTCWACPAWPPSESPSEVNALPHEAMLTTQKMVNPQRVLRRENDSLEAPVRLQAASY